MAIPVESKAQTYVTQKGWASRESGTQLNIEYCPLCGKDNFHFYMNRETGAWDCKVCGESGSLPQLMERLGDRITGAVSMKDMAMAGSTPPPLADAEAAHRALLTDEQALEYLIGDRGFTMAVIEKQKLGVETIDGKKWLLIPYYNKGRLVYTKSRTIPPAEREFRNPTGREAPLYNEELIQTGLEEIVFVEGEGDALSLMSQGYTNVVAVPGANLKKASWITKLDEIKPKRIYLCYDRDKVGQRAAKEMANRIGSQVFNILLPEFEYTYYEANGEQAHRPGKDLNEWFLSGAKLDDFKALMAKAKPFDVDGVVNAADVLDEVKDELSGKVRSEGLEAPWPSVRPKLGPMQFGDVVAIIAEGKVGKTTMAQQWAYEYTGDDYKLTSMVFCQEMPPKRLARKLISHITQTDDTPGKSQMSPDAVDKAKQVILQRPGDMLFAYRPGARPDEVFETMRQAVRRYGVKVIVFDNLQLLVRSVEHAAQETSVLSKRFKQFALENNVLILLIVQPNRVKDGEIVAARNALGSSAIEKDVDTMIALHRKRVAKLRDDQFQGYLDTDENFEPQLLFRVDLSRYAPGGVTTLWMDGARSTVREITPDELTAMPKPSMGGIPVEQTEQQEVVTP